MQKIRCRDWHMINRHDEKGRCLCDSRMCRARRVEIPYGLITQTISMFGGTGVLLLQFLNGGHSDPIFTLVGFSMMGIPIFKENLPAKKDDDAIMIGGTLFREKEKDDLTLRWEAADGAGQLARMLETEDVIEKLEIEDEIDYRLGLKERPARHTRQVLVDRETKPSPKTKLTLKERKAKFIELRQKAAIKKCRSCNVPEEPY